MVILHCKYITHFTASLFSPPPPLLCLQQALDASFEEVIVVDGRGVAVVAQRVAGAQPLGAAVVAVALEQDARLKLELLLSTDVVLDLGRTFREQPQQLVSIVPWNLPRSISQKRDCFEVPGQHGLQRSSILAFWNWKVRVEVRA